MKEFIPKDLPPGARMLTQEELTMINEYVDVAYMKAQQLAKKEFGDKWHNQIAFIDKHYHRFMDQFRNDNIKF